MTDPIMTYNQQMTRRHFLGQGVRGLGGVALASMLAPSLFPQRVQASTHPEEISASIPYFFPKAKRAIYLFMAGAPSQLDMWDYKPNLRPLYNQQLPDSIRQGQRITGMTSGQNRLPIAPSLFSFKPYGQNGTWISELLPWTTRIVDEIAVIKSLHGEAINHEPAISFINTGNMNPGSASLGSWLAYGLGTLNENLPTFVVLTSKFRMTASVQSISSRLWSSGFLPTKYAGVAFRSAGDPVLYLNDPHGMNRSLRREMLDGLDKMNQIEALQIGDPEVEARIAQYEMAFRMQSSVPELTDISKESPATLDLYGPEVKEAGTFASNCLLARRMMERGVRFVQIYHRGWDQHNNLPTEIKSQCHDVDQGCYGLIRDLKVRGLLEDTLVIWGGEFGRTVYCQGALTHMNYGRDHHPRCWTMWMAGAGVKPGITYGATDDFSYNITENPVHVRDLNATILHQFGLNADQLTFRYKGLDQRLVGVEGGNVVQDILC